MQIPDNIKNAVATEEQQKEVGKANFLILVNVLKKGDNLFSHWCDNFTTVQRTSVKEYVGSKSWTDILFKIKQHFYTQK